MAACFLSIEDGKGLIEFVLVEGGFSLYAELAVWGWTQRSLVDGFSIRSKGLLCGGPCCSLLAFIGKSGW
jgi:hypothetical protein